MHTDETAEDKTPTPHFTDHKHRILSIPWLNSIIYLMLDEGIRFQALHPKIGTSYKQCHSNRMVGWMNGWKRMMWKHYSLFYTEPLNPLRCQLLDWWLIISETQGRFSDSIFTRLIISQLPRPHIQNGSYWGW